MHAQKAKGRTVSSTIDAGKLLCAFYLRDVLLSQKIEEDVQSVFSINFSDHEASVGLPLSPDCHMADGKSCSSMRSGIL